MAFLQDARIFYKLAAGYTAMLVVILTFGTYSYFSMSRLASLTDQLYEHPYAVGTSIRDVRYGISEIYGSIKATLLSETPEEVSRIEETIQAEESEILRQFEFIRQHFIGDQQLLTNAADLFARWKPLRQAIITAAKSGDKTAAANLTGGENAAHQQAMDQAIQALLDFSNSNAEGLHDKAESLWANVSFFTIAALILAVTFAIGAAITIDRSISLPITRLVASMNMLLQGNLSAQIVGAERKDEIGDIGRAVAVFQEHAQERQRLEAVSRQTQEQEKKRQQGIESLVSGFRSRSHSVLQNVVAQATGMKSSADNLTRSSRRTADSSSLANTASSDASSNVQAVASATEQLTVSIREISDQINRTSRLVIEASGSANDTNSKIVTLSEAAQRIGNVVSLIQNIAEQTNLLALNATIEAARAGEAGKGFAIVASEVKELATQTAKATEEISSQISNIQFETDGAVTAIEEIAKKIAEVNENTSAVAAAVEEQSVSASEISRNIQEASQGTQMVEENISSVSASIEETSSAAAQMLKASTNVSEQADEMQMIVERFLKDVEAA